MAVKNAYSAKAPTKGGMDSFKDKDKPGSVRNSNICAAKVRVFNS